MLDAALVTGTFMLGLAGAPHCTAMCAAPCAALTGPGTPPLLAFHAARAAGYAAAGAAAAGGLAGLSGLAEVAVMLRPLWALVHVALLALGLWLLWCGRQPVWLARLGRPMPRAAGAAGWQAMGAPPPAKKRASNATGRAGLAGGLWFAWPCGLLQSALLVSALCSSAAGGALAMAAFALASSAGLLWAPMLARRLGLMAAGTGTVTSASARRPDRARERERWALRAAGLLVAVTSGWALTAGVWHRVAAYCATLV